MDRLKQAREVWGFIRQDQPRKANTLIHALRHAASSDSYYDEEVRRFCDLAIDADESCDVLVAMAELTSFLERWHAPRPTTSNRDPELNP